MKTIEVRLKKNEEKIIPYIWINGEENHIQVNAVLSEEGARLIIVGIFFATGANSVIFNTKIAHRASHTKSLTAIRGVFLNNSSFNNDGLINIQKGAKNADGYFSSKILLFNDAKGRSVPSLEIDENEVKAGHASTVGRPNEEQLFYLKSRGLSEKEAEKLIITGFFQPLLGYLTQSEQKNIVSKVEHLIHE